MKPILRERDTASLTPSRHLLEEAGIPTFVRNETLPVTEVTIPNFMPTLCVVNDEDLPRALELIRGARQRAAEAATDEVACPSCGEKVPGNFEICWNCGESMAAPAV